MDRQIHPAKIKLTDSERRIRNRPQYGVTKHWLLRTLASIDAKTRPTEMHSILWKSRYVAQPRTTPPIKGAVETGNTIRNNNNDALRALRVMTVDGWVAAYAFNPDEQEFLLFEITPQGEAVLKTWDANYALRRPTVVMKKTPTISFDPVVQVETHAGAPLRGYRTWTVDEESDDGIWRLKGSYGGTWTEAKYTARCQLNDFPANPTPEDVLRAIDTAREHLSLGTCTCGIYALKVKNEKPNRDLAIIRGVVALEGFVVDGERGYRAQRATIERMWVSDWLHPKVIEGVSAQFNVPWEVL